MRSFQKYMMQWFMVGQCVALDINDYGPRCSMSVYVWEGDKRVMASMTFKTPETPEEWHQVERALLSRCAKGWSRFFGQNTKEEHDDLLNKFLTGIPFNFFEKGDMWKTYRIV